MAEGENICHRWRRRLAENHTIHNGDRKNLTRILEALDPKTPEDFFRVEFVGGVVDQEPLLDFLATCIKEVNGTYETKSALIGSVRWFLLFFGGGGRVSMGCWGVFVHGMCCGGGMAMFGKVFWSLRCEVFSSLFFLFFCLRSL